MPPREATAPTPVETGAPQPERTQENNSVILLPKLLSGLKVWKNKIFREPFLTVLRALLLARSCPAAGRALQPLPCTPSHPRPALCRALCAVDTALMEARALSPLLTQDRFAPVCLPPTQTHSPLPFSLLGAALPAGAAGIWSRGYTCRFRGGGCRRRSDPKRTQKENALGPQGQQHT